MSIFGSSTPASGGFSFNFASSASTQSSTPAFGGFGGTSSPFGATPASSAAFSFGGTGASSASLFGGTAASTPSLFGAASAPASSASPFSFNTTSALVTTPASIPGFGSLFASQPATTVPAAPFGQQQQQGQVFTSSTRYDELPQNVQQQFAQVQDEISKYATRAQEVQQTLQNNRAAAGAPPGAAGLEAECSRMKDELAGMCTSADADNQAMADFRTRVVRLLKATEGVVRTFQRSKLWREAPQQYKGQMLPQALQELLASPVLLPSPFLEQAVVGFQQNVDEYKRTLGELEQVLAASQAGLGGLVDSLPDMDLGATLSTIVANLHDYFTHVAARLERVHSEVQRAKAAYLAQRRVQGDYSDPFERARKHLEYTAQREAAAAAAARPALTAATHTIAAAPQQAAAGALPAPAAAGPAAGTATGLGSAFGTPTAGTTAFGAAPSAFGSPFVGASAAGGFGAPAQGGGSLSRSSSKTGRSAKKR